MQTLFGIVRHDSVMQGLDVRTLDHRDAGQAHFHHLSERSGPGRCIRLVPQYYVKAGHVRTCCDEMTCRAGANTISLYLPCSPAVRSHSSGQISRTYVELIIPTFQMVMISIMAWYIQKK